MRQKLIGTSGNWDGHKDVGEGKDLIDLHKVQAFKSSFIIVEIQLK